MTVNRRTALRQLLAISAGAALLPSCLQDRSKSGILLKHFQLSEGQENMLAELTETILPKTSTPGAKDISAHLFVLKMLDDCYSKDDQQQFLRGLRQIDEAARKTTGSSFLKCSPAERSSLVATMDGKKDAGPDGKKALGPDGKKDAENELDFCYVTTKRLTVLAYSTSAFFMTKVHVYELVPGRYHGCVPVKNELKTAS